MVMPCPHWIAPMVERNGSSAWKVVEKIWSPPLRMLKTVPMSMKAAAETGPKIGSRYSKLPSNCVSAPMGWKPRLRKRGFAPSGPVNVPSAAKFCKSVRRVASVTAPVPFAATTTFCVVTNCSNGTMGLIWRGP
jgi:hypothetical protein